MKLTLTKSEAQDFILRNFSLSGVDTVEIQNDSPAFGSFVPPSEARMNQLITEARAATPRNKIAAIKALREATGFNLRDSKNWVEALWGEPDRRF